MALSAALAFAVAGLPNIAMAQTSGITARELTARINKAFDLIRSGQSDSGRSRLTAALQAAADSDNFALTVNAYVSAAKAFAGASDNATATTLFDEALTTRAAQRGGRDVALLWFEYGNFLSKTNQNERGIVIAAEARRRLRQAYGASSAEDIAGGDLLSSMLVNNGQVASGLNLSEEIYTDARKNLGDQEPLTWRTANNYAEALRMVGHPEAAIAIDEALLRNRIKRYGLGSIQALVSSSNVALNHLAMGNEPATMQALDVQRKSAVALSDPRSEHIPQADVWIAYAKAFYHPDRAMRRPDLDAMSKVKDWTGAPDLLRIKSAQLAADQFEKRGDSDRALALRIDAYKLSQSSVSPAHPMTFDALLDIALTRMRRGDPETLATFRDLDGQVFRWMLREVGTAGNRFVAETTRRLADDILYEYGRYALTEPAAASAYAEAVTRWKTMEDGARTKLRLAVGRLLGEETRALAHTVLRLSGQQQELLSSGKIDDEARAVLDQLQAARRALLARTGNDPQATTAAASIEDRLRPRDALVDFFVSGRRNRAGVTERQPEMRLQAVVRRNAKPPALLDLGPMSAFVGMDVAAADREKQSRRLYDMLLGPLKPHIADTDRLFLVPDADLYSLPFALLQDGSGRYLDEIFDIRILTRADAVFFTDEETHLAAGQKALLVGGLDYAGAAQQLPSTRSEIDRVETDLKRAGLQTTMLSGDSTEADIKAKSQEVAIVHLATHGFFKAASDRTDALWRSGLLASRPNLNRPRRRDPNDGVLYARELMDWDLSAADLVVLSACQTALGDASRIGSVRGMPTALAIAGAKRSLLTLWEVNDEGVANFMARFYQVLADEKLDYAAALRKVRIEALRGKVDGASDPAVWAAFAFFES